jgi:class 3 adenylate cyclase/tetratricopeptide (TPR) repeat protein
MDGITMQCPKCQFENREGAKFCVTCGNKLEINCSSCGHLNPPGSRFCEECGINLSLPTAQAPKELSFDEKIAKVQKYLPKGLTEKILAQKNRIEGERKEVTVMFCDMQGFTSLSEKMGIEGAYEIMDQIYEILIHKVHDYEGTVNEMTGDGIMALFGAPIALEDAPQRAIRSAYSIHREMTKFSEKIKQENGIITPIRMRIGIHTGPVVVGTLGNDLRVEFKAVGDTVNLASRMEALAEPGTTYVTEDTLKLTEGLFRFEALGAKQVKGKEVSVKTYRVIAPSTRRTRFDISAERGLTPFVGRRRELELLLDGFDRAKEGRGQAFSIVSEAGVGKSRLLYEFRKAVANEDLTFLEGKCLSYSKGVAYHPIIDILKSNFDILEGEIREKVQIGLNILQTDQASTLPYLLEVLSVKDSGIDQISMSPEAKKDRILEAVKRITLKGAEIRPLILAYEDLHWMDKSSEELLKRVLENIPGVRVLMIFTYRPDFVCTWGAKSYHNQVNLNRLSNRESLTMVTNLLGTKEIDPDLEDLILEKTEGIPFFIEEFIKSLKDLKIIATKDNKYYLAKDIQEVTIPSTIQDVIMARVDSLSENAKEVLQRGSVIGREFSYELIKRVTNLSQEELLSDLSLLKDSELLYERGIYPESTYIFKHALTRDVVYDSLLTPRKKKLHGKIGNVIEALFKENIYEYYAVLAEHYIAGQNYEKGAEYSKLAAENAEKTGAISDAIGYARKRVASIENLPRIDDVQKRMIDARTALGLYLIRMLCYAEAKEAVEPIIDVALKIAHKARLAQILTILGNSEYFVEENVPRGFKHLEEAVKICEELEDNIFLGLATWRLGIALSLNCEFEKATRCYEKALNINEAANNLWGVSVTKSYLSFYTYFLEGRINLAYQTSDEAIQIAEESGDIYSKAMAYTVHGERINFYLFNAIARWMLGEVCYEIGEYQNSKEHYSTAVTLIKLSGGFRSCWTVNYIGAAMAMVMMNVKNIDLKSFYGHVYDNKLRVYKSWKLRYIAEILLNIDDQHLSEAENWIKKAIEMHKRHGMQWYLARDYTLYADLLKRKGDTPKANEKLRKAIEIFKKCGADGWVAKYEKELATLS